MEKVSLDQAKKEVNKWLDFKKVDNDKRDENTENIDALAKAISLGYLILDKDHNFIQDLKFPIEDSEGSPVQSQLKFKPRLTVGEVNKVSNGVKPGDQRANMIANTSARTGNPKAIIDLMDAEDFDTTALIMAYFL